MTFFEMLGTLLIGPLKLIFEVIFSVALTVIGNPGLSIIVLSLAMNVLVLPLYRRADAIQIEARDTENKLKDVVTHIKKTFSGDERMMILQTYYRQNNYNPLSVLSGSISLLLEIPFFMAAYQFLSGVSAFSGTSFGPIADLSAPDGLIVIGGITINLLPIIMTLVNVISSSLYLKGFPLKTKIQLYGMAAFFLVFLYNSPAALVFYWTLNNLFSLIKTLFYKIKNSKRILQIFLAVFGVVSVAIGIAMEGFWRSAFMILLGVVSELPWILPLLKKLPFPRKEAEEIRPNKTLFIFGGLFLTVLVGLLIPGTYISASVQEYIYTYCFYEPIWYIVQTLCISAGTFLVWLGVFYWLANPKGKVIFERLVWILSGVML
ncbi:MAG: membrane protein insertase YidC, partial [Oscillospiraceae bacterium]|nr:membrane protein insertase YidC [Oscillospiraceae bacterium]